MKKKTIEMTAKNGENAYYQYFLLLLQCFPILKKKKKKILSEK